MIVMIKRKIRQILLYFRKKRLMSCGKNVNIQRGAHLEGNICVGSNVLIGTGDYFVSTKAKLWIHDDVVFGPFVTIYTGDHAIDIIGKHISEITDSDKELTGGTYDKDVIIESGCWIGTRAIILKGVTIGHGSVIGAGAIVTKSVPPYSIYVGVPGSRVLKRFTDEQILKHESLLLKRGKTVS